MIRRFLFSPVWSDILLWGFLVLLVAGLVRVTPTDAPGRRQQRLTLSFQDANEMVRGSNVRMMGVDIGFVEDIRLHENQVDVVIKTMPGVPPIPPGSRATIKFTGLVGSKSIEIEPPDSPTAKDAPLKVIIEEPIRLKAAIQYNIDIAQALQNGAEHFSDFFGRRKSLEGLQRNILLSNDETHRAVGHLESGLVRLSDVRDKYTLSRGKLFAALGHFDQSSEKAVRLLDRRVFGSSVPTVLAYFDALFRESESRLRTFQVQGGYLLARGKVAQFRSRLNELQNWIPQHSPAVALSRLEARAAPLHNHLTDLDRFLALGHLPALQQARQALRQISRRLESMNRQF